MGKFVLRNTIIDILLRIEEDSGYSHLLLNNAIKSNKISPKDEGLLTEIVYGTMQRKITLDFYLHHFINPKKKLDPWVRILLRMSIYQMLFLDKVPDHAILHEAVEIAKQRGHKGIASFVNAILRNIQRNGVPSTKDIQDDVKRLSVETSHPEWLVDRWIKAYGFDITKEMCLANLQHKPISIRIQPMKISREEAMDKLTNEGIHVKPSPFSSQGIIIEKGNILKSALFEEGIVTIQDQSSMLVGEMIDAKPGDVVLDTCSAPGGKVTHIAEKMRNQGTIYAHDLHKNKIKLIQRKAEQLGLSIINAKAMDARKLADQYEPKSFDRILVDAPCSGLGVIRGKPDIKYNKTADDIQNLARIQQDILQTVAPLLKSNGVLIYSTCTVDPVENEEVVKEFLKNHPNYEVDETFFDMLPEDVNRSIGITEYGLQLFPQTYQTDGFFLTRLIRNS